MKKLFYVLSFSLAFIALLSLSSCTKSGSSSKGGTDPIPPGLLGTWHRSPSSWTYYITFYDNYTYKREGEAERNDVYSYSISEGVFTVDGQTIRCHGPLHTYYGDGSEEHKDDESWVFTFDGETLKSGSNNWYR